MVTTTAWKLVIVEEHLGFFRRPQSIWRELQELKKNIKEIPVYAKVELINIHSNIVKFLA